MGTPLALLSQSPRQAALGVEDISQSVPMCPGAQPGWVGGLLGPGAADTGSGPTLCHLPAERVLRLVDCVSGAAQDFAGHDDWVQLCRFSPSASLLFTAAHNQILVWEVTGC